MNRSRTALVFLAGLTAAVAARGEDVAIHIVTQAHPHVRALLDGRVAVQGCQVRFSTATPAMLQERLDQASDDVLEVDIVPYLERKAAGRLKDYTLIPVFLSRQFQMRNVYIRSDRGMTQPQDLRGKTVGVSGYRTTTPTWLRGILRSSWTITPEEIHWVDVQEASAPVHSLVGGLSSGALDAAFGPDLEADIPENDSKLRRLFPDYRQAEYDTFKQTRIFPIVTAVAVRQKLVDDYPWLPEALFIAFSQAKKKAMAEMTLPLPWGGAQLEETEKLMGKNFWSYGVKSNPKTLGALFRYVEQQGLLAHPLKIEDVFTPSTMMLLEN